MKYAISSILLLAALALGQNWIVEQIDSMAAAGSPVELVKAADGRLWAGYQTDSGVVRVACLGDSGWVFTDVCSSATLPWSGFRPFLAAGPHGELCLAFYDSLPGDNRLYRMTGDAWHSEPNPFNDSGPCNTVAYDTAGHLYTTFLPSAGDFWIGHETDSGWTSSQAVSLFIYGWFWVDVSCLTVAADGSPWHYVYVAWDESPYHWGTENALMHYTGGMWRQISGGSAVPLALVPHGDSAGWVTSDLPSPGFMLCDGDTVGPVNDNMVAGLAYTAAEVPLVAWVPRFPSSDIPLFAFKTNRWHVESIPGPAGTNGIDIETDSAGQVMIVYSTEDSGLWCARGADVVGVREGPKPQAVARKLEPTILSGASGVRRLASCIVFDAMGRRVMNPRSGVYFVWEAQAQGQAQAVRKVVIQR